MSAADNAMSALNANLRTSSHSARCESCRHAAVKPVEPVEQIIRCKSFDVLVRPGLVCDRWSARR
jgi:hypothetical protein